MAKIVDHDQKRRDIVEVTARIIAEEGMEAVTTRRIANASGCSLGILSHYFANKNEIVLGALNWCDARFEPQLAEMYSDSFLSLNDFHALFLTLLPLDEISDIEWRVRVNMVTYSLTHPELKKARLEMLEWAYELAIKFVKKLQEDGEVSKDFDAAIVGENAVDMAYGLAVNLLNFPLEHRRKRVDDLLKVLPTALNVE